MFIKWYSEGKYEKSAPKDRNLYFPTLTFIIQVMILFKFKVIIYKLMTKIVMIVTKFGEEL